MLLRESPQILAKETPAVSGDGVQKVGLVFLGLKAVSYTHLTLPTKLEV